MRDIRVSWFETAQARLLTMRGEPPHFSRRRFLKSTAAGLLSAAVPQIARAQLATQPPPKQPSPDEFSVAAPVSIEVNAPADSLFRYARPCPCSVWLPGISQRTDPDLELSRLWRAVGIAARRQ